MEAHVGARAFSLEPKLSVPAMRELLRSGRTEVPSAGKAAAGDSLRLSQAAGAKAAPGGATGSSFTQSFLEVSDGHSYLNNLPRFATALKQARAADPGAIFLYNGDSIVGTPYYEVGALGLNGVAAKNHVPGLADMQQVDRLQPDSFVIGNHDLDGGLDHLAQVLDGTSFPVTIANWTLAPSTAAAPNPLADLKMPDGSPRIKPYQVVQRDGRNVAIVGLSVDPAQYGCLDSRVTYQDPATTLANLIPQIQAKYGQNTLIVAQTHIGEGQDNAMAKDPRFGDVVFFAAHDHIPLGSPIVDKQAGGDENGVLDTGAYYNNLGVLKVTQDGTGHVTNLTGGLVPTASLTPDAATVAAQSDVENAVTAQYRQPIAKVPQAITRAKIAGTGDSALGDYVTDVMLRSGNAYLAAKGEPPADMALFNSTGIRTDLAPAADGTVDREAVYDLMPFSDNIGVGHFTTPQLHAILDNNASRGGDPVSGVQDVLQGSHATNVVVNGLGLDDPANADRIWNVVSSDYMLTEGGSGYTAMTQGAAPADLTPINIRDALIQAVSSAGTLQLKNLPVRQAVSKAPKPSPAPAPGQGGKGTGPAKPAPRTVTTGS